MTMINNNEVNSFYNWVKDKPIRSSHKNAFQMPRNATTLNSTYVNNSNRLHQISNDDFEFNDMCHYQVKPKISNSESEVRFINPAIYAEDVHDEEKEDIAEVRVRVCCKNDVLQNRSCNKSVLQKSLSDLNMTSNSFSNLMIQNDLHVSNINFTNNQVMGPDTYRCYSTVASGEPFTVQSKSDATPIIHTERRCKISEKSNGDCFSTVSNDPCFIMQTIQPEDQKYTLNDHRVTHLSTTSITSSSASQQKLNGLNFVNKISHDEWLRKKQMSIQRKKKEENQLEAKKFAEEEKLANEKIEKERRERDNFVQWTERKKREDADKKAVQEKQIKLQQCLKEIEDKAIVAKTLCLRQWSRKKEAEQKVRQKAQQRKQERIDEERKKRFEESSKAYEKWRQISKNRPRPATQGLLPHQTAKPAYVNPAPWQKIVDNDSEEAQEDSKKKINKRKISIKKSILTQ